MTAQENCYDFTCVQKCCNYDGGCPQYQYSSTALSQCYYYYNSLSPAGLAGIIVGSLVGVAILIIVIVCCIRAHKNKQIKMAIASHNNGANNPVSAENYIMPSTHHPGQFMIPNNQPTLIPYAQPNVNPYVGESMAAINPSHINPPPYFSPDYQVHPNNQKISE